MDTDHIRIGRLEKKFDELDEMIEYCLKCIRMVGCAAIALSFCALVISFFALEVF